MIEYIVGKLTELNPTYAVIEAAGVGYEINIALPTFSALTGREVTGDGLPVTGDEKACASRSSKSRIAMSSAS